MNKYIVEEIDSGAVYIFGIESIEPFSGVYIRPRFAKGLSEVKPLANIKFNTFRYKIHGPLSKWARENESEPEVDTDGRLLYYKSTILPLKDDGKVDSAAYLEFESDDDAKLFAEVLHNEYISKHLGGDDND